MEEIERERQRERERGHAVRQDGPYISILPQGSSVHRHRVFLCPPVSHEGHDCIVVATEGKSNQQMF